MPMNFDELKQNIKKEKGESAKEDAEYVVKMCKDKRNFYLEESVIINGKAKTIRVRVTKKAYIEALLEERGYARDKKLIEHGC